MHKIKLLTGSTLFFTALFLTIPALAQITPPPPSQTAGGVVRQEAQRFKQKRLEEKIEREKVKIDEVSPEDVVTPDDGLKTSVDTIVVEDATLLSESEIRKVTSKYEGRELSLKAMQKVADLITDEYRKKGYVTSRAYIPPQSILEGKLIIKVVEGRLGTLEIRGNKYFSASMLEKKMGIEPDGHFDYSVLQKSLVYINQNPDRLARAVLVPGEQPGTTDIILNVEDNYPFHVAFSYDNYGSRYIAGNRYGIALEHNNLTGHDDKLYVKGQLGEDDRFSLQQMRYSYPVSRKWEVGGYALLSKTELGEEFEDLGSEGKAQIFGTYSNYRWIEKDDLDIGLNFGFDSMNIDNSLGGVQLSRDELKVAKAGIDIDYIDSWGRTILTAQVGQGIPNFMGSMDSKDSDASRVGAGGKFTKGTFNLFRLQPMFWETAVLLKNSFQMSNNTLVASEQFQIGGPTSVRGYPPGEFSGDQGFYSAFEWSIPMYGLSKDIKVPFREEKIYDTLRFVLFYDIGYVNNNSPGEYEAENQTLRGAGFGARLTMAQDFELRVETGYPLGGPDPSDGDTAHTWVEVHIKF